MRASWSEVLFQNLADHTAHASSASEGTLLAGTNRQPIIPAGVFMEDGRTLRTTARGVLSNTGTPTIIFQLRMGTTAGSSDLTGDSIGVSAAITTQSGVSNVYWELVLDLICTTPGIGTNNATLAGAGKVLSPDGFASPFVYPLEPTTPDTATWTITIDANLRQYINLSATWSASSASNTITCKQLICELLN